MIVFFRRNHPLKVIVTFPLPIKKFLLDHSIVFYQKTPHQQLGRRSPEFVFSDLAVHNFSPLLLSNILKNMVFSSVVFLSFSHFFPQV